MAIKKWLIIGLLVLSTTIFAGCNFKAKENTISKDTSKQFKQIVKEEIQNNGGLYVSYGGNVYYRQYTSESFHTDGIFGNYEEVAGTNKNMMCIGKDGKSKVIFSDTGTGDIYIYKDKMYLQEDNDDYSTSIYVIDLDGKNKQVIGTGSIKGIDEDKGILVCILADENKEYQLYKYDCVAGTKTRYNLSVPYADFLSLKDGVIYYSGKVNNEDSKLGKVKLCSVNLDGTNQKLLAETNSDLYQFGSRGTKITCMQIVGDIIYFSYGAYDGTANIYQGGKIANVSKDGSGFKVLVGNQESSDGTNILAGDRFYVTNNTLYYLEGIEDLASRALNLTTGDKQIVDFNVNPEGKAFEDENSVKIYLNQSDKATTLIPNVDYGKLGLDLNAYKYNVYDVQQCGDWVYYKIEANQENPKASIGWRTGYTRIKTAVIRRNVNTNNEEVLFQY